MAFHKESIQDTIAMVKILFFREFVDSGAQAERHGPETADGVDRYWLA
jgi:hypothetical protein